MSEQNQLRRGPETVKGEDAAGKFTAINPAAFKGGFSEANLLAYLARDALRHKYGLRSNLEGSAQVTAKTSLDGVQQLMGVLVKAGTELQQLHKEVSKTVSQLQVSYSIHEAEYKMEVENIQTSGGAIRKSFEDLEARMARVSQIGTRIGDRLQTADSLRSRALQMIEIMGYLRQFSELREGQSDKIFKKQLPPVFWEEGGLQEAAVLTRRLTNLVVDAMSAKQRSKLLVVNVDDSQDASSTKGSLEYTYARLQQYSSWLEVRMVARFDVALENDDLTSMAECAKVMEEFGRGKAITQRYVSTHPLLMIGEEEALSAFTGRPKGGSGSELQLVLKPLDELYKTLLDAVLEEVERTSYIFADPKKAMELFTQRLFEERVKPAIDRILGRSSSGSVSAFTSPGGSPSPGNSSSNEPESDEDKDPGPVGTTRTKTHPSMRAKTEPYNYQHRVSHHTRKSDLMRNQVVTMAEVYRRTRTFMDGLQAAASGPPAGPLDLNIVRDGLFGSFLTSYPQPELQWLMSRYEEEVEGRAPVIKVSESSAVKGRPSASGTALSSPPAERAPLPPSLELVQQLLHCHQEAVKRAETLATGQVQLAGCIRAMFLGEGPFAPMNGSLLQLLVHHVLDGVEATLDLCNIRDFKSKAKADVAAAFETRKKQREQLMIARYEAYMDHEALPEAPKLMDVEKSTAKELGEKFVQNRVMKVLQAAKTATGIMSSLQQHFNDSLSPLLAAGSLSDLGACEAGLLTLLRAAEESVLLVLRKCMEVVVIQIEKTLMLEQRAAEFLLRVKDVQDMSFSRPTNACMLVCSIWSAFRDAAGENLEGANLSSLLTEVGLKVHGVVLNHIQQFHFSPHGALKLKADVNEYTECARSMEQPQLLEKFTAAQGLINILVVSPESILPLVNGSLRMEHREALKYAKLREDFEVARVDGRSITQLLSQAGLSEGGARR
ncbi:hypothetical protein CEUSTIGMA_g1742.t1 [Chlamydomonas eustigma]|uniref:Exocyst complex component Sec10 n=1 Tax=Chlamydomonas eustigma TaxID=1157962 RepID=A0A250WTZ5_9CHLO|nr:hypothetical protein CEUSTIGMA_g1742.t1 [Chlamydomonas eustigma]|eukprot:GAX74293.1 hypothetical protein CEUSTIGMA_g1742.t1 [Chlamydomonas eustigma]